MKHEIAYDFENMTEEQKNELFDRSDIAFREYMEWIWTSGKLKVNGRVYRQRDDYYEDR